MSYLLGRAIENTGSRFRRRKVWRFESSLAHRFGIAEEKETSPNAGDVLDLSGDDCGDDCADDLGGPEGADAIT